MPILFFIFLIFLSTVSSVGHAGPAAFPKDKYIILYIWDGLRFDAVSAQTTPNLYKLMQKGVQFRDNHSSYPTFTMMNAASFATGDRAGKTGFYGNTLWHPGINGVDNEGKPVDFQQPVFTEDYKILQGLDHESLFFAETLFSAAHKKNITTATIGKSGPAFMQDYLSQGIIFDEKHIFPLSLIHILQQQQRPLPKNSLVFAAEALDLHLAANNGDPTAPTKIYYEQDTVTTNPFAAPTSPFVSSNQYLMKTYLGTLLPNYRPKLTVIWLRNPDSTEHLYGPGSIAYYQALRSNDELLGELIQKLKTLGIYHQVDIIIGSDHAHSNVSAPLNLFPLRKDKKTNANGSSVSGTVRIAHFLTQDGFNAFDGTGCIYNPIMSGIGAQGTPLFPTKIDTTGNLCGKKNMAYTTPAYQVPHLNLPNNSIIVAPNGGSDYFYVPSHNKKLINKLVRWLQGHEIIDILFVDSTRYGELPGTLPLAVVNIQNLQGRSPDIIAGMGYDATAKINGLAGIEFSDSKNERGMHGSFSPIDVHNFLVASGPDFKKHFTDHLPTGNVDVAPTIAYLLGLPFHSEGRILYEALANSKTVHYQTSAVRYQPKMKATNLKIYNSLNQLQQTTTYTAVVQGKLLTENGRPFLYFDSGKSVRD